MGAQQSTEVQAVVEGLRLLDRDLSEWPTKIRHLVEVIPVSVGYVFHLY